MDSERRGHSMESVLVTLGELKAIATHTKEEVDKLSAKVGIQNGRVTKLERWQSYTHGAIMVIILLVLPIIINFVSSWLQHTFH